MTRAWALGALERAVKTFAQAVAAVMTAGAADLLAVDWGAAFSAGGFAAAYSIVTSIMSAPVNSDGSPSLVGEKA